MRQPLLRRLAAVAMIIAVWAPTARAASISSLIIFGDSLSDTGNVLNRTNAFSLFATPRPTVPWYDTGRWSNGTTNDGSNTTPPRTTETAYGGVWHERLADKLHIARATNSLDGGNNWAYGGATTGTGTFSGALALQNIRNQVDSFLATNPTIDANQLYAIWGGGNDVRDAAAAANATVDSIKAAATNALANLSDSIQTLAVNGATQFFWPNLPPLDRTPEAAGLNATARDGLKQASELFRDDQAAAVTTLLNNNDGIEICVLDVYGLFTDVLAHPANFGYTNITSGVISAGDFTASSFTPTANFPNMQVDADKFLFWDQVHPTARTHDLIGTAAFMKIAMVPEPATTALVASLLVIVFWRRRPNV